MNLYNLERSTTTKVARKAIGNLLNTYHLKTKTIVKDASRQVSHVAIFDEAGNELAAGSGKGKNHSIGAQAEAIEHYLLMQDTLKVLLQPTTFSKIIDQNEFKLDGILRASRNDNDHGYENDNNKNNRLQSVNFTNAITQRNCLVPYVLVNPFYAKMASLQEQTLGKYSSNSGTSLGITFEDAYLHGINETIERHYYSQLCLDLIGRSTGIKWHLICSEMEFATPEILTTRKKIVGDTNSEVMTVFTQTPFNSFVAFSFLKDSSRCRYKFKLSMAGGGSSLSFDLAILRSMDELLQLVALNSEKENAEDEQAIAFLSANGLLRKLIYIEFSDLKKISSPLSPPLHFSKRMAAASTKDQVIYLNQKLFAAGFSPLFREILNHEGVSIVQVFIPGMDRFHLIRSGLPVVPQNYYFTRRDYENN
ncbi:MAG: hypothetical protein A2504_13920 [Bdellovibrionales bacterium RIFOXYD12_FULL_39_22]|nr:MAG: hypothetical protein A2385_00645 [Bdellovibrionales bacterium RIFOXYB1_FULL_39_21]OFZ43814.1 MAG: hypothetical protein A2485_04885 [Bdellovibrionales bacterium RIFOXYC12_FULL_39_17]OFZ48852.1 MAG: hypothetical protein A2404_17960 [Bdellovibrionales bacterium RIFOXYC1_FULL_39_130]OFZ76585.1 MAG: hypothetical protein A2560_06625 [Bdellovibrionales bacterium RIFOXYD1_FULL_39_84]OFZ94819.1 MAG: hypothetical protein A2504_13920 [Bdellovibrionales bacterium RIFOXYD12_FULL_39_22]HLE12243.1 Yc